MQLVSVLYLAALIVGLVSVILAPRVKYFDKFTWVLFVLFLPFIGIIGWFAFGRDRTAPAVAAGHYDAERVTSADDIVEAELD